MLRGVLTEANHVEVLREAKHKTKAELEMIIARLAPKPDVPTRLARLAERPGGTRDQAMLELPRPAAPTEPDAATLALGFNARPTPTPTAALTPAPSAITSVVV